MNYLMCLHLNTRCAPVLYIQGVGLIVRFELGASTQAFGTSCYCNAL